MATVEVSPPNHVLVSLQDTVRLEAIARDNNGRRMPGRSVTWSSTNASVADVSTSALVTAISNGSTSIEATIDQVKGSATITVQQAVRSLTVPLGQVTLTALGDSVLLTAVARDARNNIFTAPILWTSTATNVATVDGSGRVVAIDNGTAVITASNDTVKAQTTVTVDQLVTSIVLGSNAVTLAPGDTFRITATMRDRRGSLVRHKTPQWSTADSNIANVNGGLATAVGRKLDGVVLTATQDLVSASSVVTLEAAFTAIGASEQHTCALTSAGVAYCWGRNTDGTLGTNGYTGSGFPVADVPVRVDGGLAFRQLSVGAHSCGVTLDFRAYCWGTNTYGEVGDGTRQNVALVPKAVSTGSGIDRISAGSSIHTCAVRTTGSPLCWGNNFRGKIGDSTAVDRALPTAVSGGRVFSAISVGSEHTCGISNGAAYCWGSGEFGERGDATGGVVPGITPQTVQGGLTFQSLSAGARHTCGIAASGAAYCWGSNLHGRLGTGDSTTRSIPTPVIGGYTFVVLSTLDLNSCGVTSAGVALCWGEGGNGQLGNGSTQYSIGPTAVSGGVTFTTISVGAQHTCGISNTNGAYCWGSNGDGQLGTGLLGQTATRPTRVRGSRP